LGKRRKRDVFLATNEEKGRGSQTGLTTLRSLQVAYLDLLSHEQEGKGKKKKRKREGSLQLSDSGGERGGKRG